MSAKALLRNPKKLFGSVGKDVGAVLNSTKRVTNKAIPRIKRVAETASANISRGLSRASNEVKEQIKEYGRNPDMRRRVNNTVIQVFRPGIEEGLRTKIRDPLIEAAAQKIVEERRDRERKVPTVKAPAYKFNKKDYLERMDRAAKKAQNKRPQPGQP